MAATILNGKVSKLYNVPDISDVKTTLEILENLGCKIKKDKKKIVIDSKNMNITTIPEELMRKLRSSVIIAGAIISRFGEAKFSYPGGCDALRCFISSSCVRTREWRLKSAGLKAI